MQSRPVIFSGHFWALRIDWMIGGRTALTELGLMALTMAREAD